jgi:hypothetical protein
MRAIARGGASQKRKRTNMIHHHYDPNQPRVPAGHDGAGEWTRDGSVRVAQAGQLVLPAMAPAVVASPAVAPAALAIAAIAAIMAAVPLFRWLSAQNSRDKHAILEFPGREYRESEKGVLAIARVLTSEQVNDACPRYDDVQKITNEEASEVRNTRPGLSPSQYGTAVHTQIRRRIDALNDPSLQAEVSYLKAQEETESSREAKWGMKGTIRVDVDEKAENNTACVYDIKTGRSGLSAARIAEIVTRVYAKGKPDRLIITEVRPQR